MDFDYKLDEDYLMIMKITIHYRIRNKLNIEGITS